MSYASYSQYVKMANAAGCSFKVVNHHEAHSPFWSCDRAAECGQSRAHLYRR
ncbi:hypothetical protein ACEQPO_23855 [Bacillus sp. SL00103]